FIIEIGLIVLIGLYVTRAYENFNPQQRMAGPDAEYLMSSVYTASEVLHSQGRIPLWTPWLNVGDPLINNPYTFLLNPIEAWPSLIVGPTNGIKISIILAIIFSGLGGWVLGRVIGLRALGRVMLGLLCIGRGNLHAVLANGWFTISSSQTYFPWIVAG